MKMAFCVDYELVFSQTMTVVQECLQHSSLRFFVLPLDNWARLFLSRSSARR